jgi:protocatechuate 3,4-dioxygenase beta subunit
MLTALILGAIMPAFLSQPAGPVLRIAGRIQPLPPTAPRVSTPGIAAPPAALDAVTIELLPAALDSAAAMRRLTGAPADPPLAVAHADAAGVFHLLAPGPGCYRVVVRAAGYLPVELPLLPLLQPLPPLDTERELPPVRLTPAVAIPVQALGPQDQPLAGVAIAIRDSDYQPVAGQTWLVAETWGTTGADGRLTLPAAADRALTLSVLDPRFLGTSQSLVAPAATDAGRSAETILRLSAHPTDQTLTIETLDPGGSAVAGALLRLAAGTPIATAGIDGRLRITTSDPRTLLMTAAPTLESPAGDLRGEISWAAARSGTVRVTLAPCRETVGSLVAGNDGHALAGGVVWAERANSFEGSIPVLAAATTGQDGTFQLRVPPGDNVRLRAAAPGYLPRDVQLPADVAPWRIALEPVQELAGLVLDDQGHPVAGASITATGPLWEPGARQAATTGQDGRFRLRALAAGLHYSLQVAADGFATASAHALMPRRPAGEPPPPPMRIVLARGRRIAGVVVDGAGRPLAGVVVTLLPSDLMEVWRSPPAGTGAGEAASDSHGAFQIDNVVPRTYSLAAHGAGWATTSRVGLELQGAIGPPLDVGRVVMEPGAVLEGTVTDRRGAAVADATIWLSPSSAGQPGTARHGYLPLRVAGDRNGRFRIAELHSSQAFDLYVQATGHLPAQIHVPAPGVQPVRIELQDECRLVGRVLDGDRQPVFGAAVWATAKNQQSPLPTLPGMAVSVSPREATGMRGEFALSGLPAGQIDLTVSAQGYRPARVRGIDLAVGRDGPPVEVVLVQGVTVAGRVLDTAGHPVAGANVTAMLDITLGDLLRGGNVRGAGPAPASSAPDGRYRLVGLGPGNYRVLVDRANSLRGLRSRQSAEIVVADQDLDLDLVAADPVSLLPVTGRIVDTDGAPIAGARIELIQETTAPGGNPFQGSLFDALSSTPRSYAAGSEEDGSFLVPDVEPGSYRLSASARGYAPGTPPDAVLVADAPVDGVELPLAPARAAIRGQIHGLGPQDLARMVVSAKAAAPSSTPDSLTATAGTVDESGAYSIGGLANGQWQVTAVTATGRTAGTMAEIVAGAPDAQVDLEFKNGAAITGTVSSRLGPLVGAAVVLNRIDAPGRPPQIQETAGDGTFRFSDLAPGSYTALAVDRRTFASARVTVQLAAEDATVAIDLTTGTLQGRVTSAATGQPIVGASMAVDRADQVAFPFPATSDADGICDLGQVTAGRYRVIASAPGFDTGQATVDVAPDATATVQIQLTPQAGR